VTVNKLARKRRKIFLQSASYTADNLDITGAIKRILPMKMKSAGLFALSLIAAAISTCSTSAQQSISYYPLSRASNLDGILVLSTKSARFSERAGSMQLRSASEINTLEIPDSWLTRMSGAAIYEVMNWQEYFRANKNKNGFCSNPLRWLTITQERPSDIWVCGYDIEKLQEYRPDKLGLCFCGMWRPYRK